MNRRLLIRSERERGREVRDGAGHETGVVAPAEGCPRASLLLEHVLQVRRLLELLIVVDRELAGRRLDEQSAVARPGENRLGVTEHHERAEAAVFDEVYPTGETVDVRMIP